MRWLVGRRPGTRAGQVGGTRRCGLVVFRASWSLGEAFLQAGQYFVIGDNRGMPMALHEMGLVVDERWVITSVSVVRAIAPVVE